MDDILMAISLEPFVALTVVAICVALPWLVHLFQRQAERFLMSDNCSTLDLVRTVNAYNDNPKFASLTELPYSATRRERRSNCKSCGAPIPANGICEYCGTDNTLLQQNETKTMNVENPMATSNFTKKLDADFGPFVAMRMSKNEIRRIGAFEEERPTKCGECKYCSTLVMNGMTYCTAKKVKPFIDISALYVKRDSLPNRCPIKEEV